MAIHSSILAWRIQASLVAQPFLEPFLEALAIRNNINTVILRSSCGAKGNGVLWLPGSPALIPELASFCPCWRPVSSPQDLWSLLPGQPSAKTFPPASPLLPFCRLLPSAPQLLRGACNHLVMGRATVCWMSDTVRSGPEPVESPPHPEGTLVSVSSREHRGSALRPCPLLSSVELGFEPVCRVSCFLRGKWYRL